MDMREPEPAQTLQYASDYLNSELDPGVMNAVAVLRGMAQLENAFNSSVQADVGPELPQNHLGENTYRTGLEGSAMTGGPKWP
jgi:hypothetical protein